MVRIEIRLYGKGRSVPFSEWLRSLRDARAVAIVRARLNRIRLGHFGDCKSIGGGDKRTQARDILMAQRRWKEYLDAKSNG